MRTVEIHADTWDFGFELWLDRAGFNLPRFQGDFDQDGDTDGRDFLDWQTGYGAGQFSASDLDNWKANFATNANMAATSSFAHSDNSQNLSQRDSIRTKAVDRVFEQMAPHGLASRRKPFDVPSALVSHRPSLAASKRSQTRSLDVEFEFLLREFLSAHHRLAGESESIASDGERFSRDANRPVNVPRIPEGLDDWPHLRFGINWQRVGRDGP